jgi:serine protease Do
MVQIRTERDGSARRAASGIVLTSTEKPSRSWVLPARHVLDPPGRQLILVSVPRRKDAFPATLVAASPDIDAAVLEVPGVSLPGVRLKDTVQLGGEVWVVAFPWGRRLTLVSGVVSPDRRRGR